MTDPPDHSAWRRSDAGVLCLVKDNQRRSYFFRLYCLTRCEMVWEHEVYNSMVYQCPKMWLHTFEGEVCSHWCWIVPKLKVHEFFGLGGVETQGCKDHYLYKSYLVTRQRPHMWIFYVMFNLTSGKKFVGCKCMFQFLTSVTCEITTQIVHNNAVILWCLLSLPIWNSCRTPGYLHVCGNYNSLENTYRHLKFWH